MAHDKNCQNCGKMCSGNINKRFCSDACRKHYKRHGNTSVTGVTYTINPDKTGHDRTTPRAGGSSIGTYAAKKGIDFLFKMAETSCQEPKVASSLVANTAISTPLQVIKASTSLTNSTKLQLSRVVLSDEFADFLGEVAYPFKMLVWGLPSSSKSTCCMAFANQIATNYQVVYIAGEEALNSPTLMDKQRRTLRGPNANRCIFLNRLPHNELEWKQVLRTKDVFWPESVKAVFYDSVTKLGITPFYVTAAANDYHLPELEKSLSHIFITHAHKDGQQYRGDGSWGHEVDIIIRVEKGVAITEKNRFGEVGRTLKIF